ncbi:hypothetical protein MCAP1_002843 [Malassezia caprae]|uniref:ARID domain-containing protein n=1 Tax=Malassezia caprae TaxID=1381934 RepID=A0AAF0ED36_9BASI|nr:hypothetical protein MCAP1_002843 [Malassezia caprae]
MTPQQLTPAQFLQNIHASMGALQRQWAMVNAQPDGPNKTAAQQYITASGAPGETRTIDLQRLFIKVMTLGGSEQVFSIPNGWSLVAQQLELAVGSPNEPPISGAIMKPSEVPANTATPSNPFANMDPAQVQFAVGKHFSQLQTLVTSGQMAPQVAMARYSAIQQALQAYHADRANKESGMSTPSTWGNTTPTTAVPRNGVMGTNAPLPPIMQPASVTQPTMPSTAPQPITQSASVMAPTTMVPPNSTTSGPSHMASDTSMPMMNANNAPMSVSVSAQSNRAPSMDASSPGAATLARSSASPAPRQPVFAGGISPSPAPSMSLPSAPAPPVVPAPVQSAGPMTAPSPGPVLATSPTPAPVTTVPGAATGITPSIQASATGVGASGMAKEGAPAGPGSDMSSTAASTGQQPSKFKIEYVPTNLEMHTHGGRDLDRIDRELVPRMAARTRPRGVHELGRVDVYGLIMSLQSGLAHEVSYALNTLLILSSGLDAPAQFRFLMAPCENLLDVLLDMLLNEMGSDDKTVIAKDTLLSKNMITYCEALELALQDEAALRLWRRQTGSSVAEQAANRRVAIVQVIFTILRNVSVMPENSSFLATHVRFVQSLAWVAHAIQADQRWGGASDLLQYFSLNELLHLRKDLVTILLGVSGESLDLSVHTPATVASLVDLVRFFVLDAAEFEHREGAPPALMERLPNQAPQSQVLLYQVPHHAQLALQAFSCFALPDANRETLAREMPADVLLQLTECLLGLLPVQMSDFRRLASSTRLEYAEAVVMCLYNVVYLAPPAVKTTIRETPGAVGILFRAVKQLLQNSQDYARNPYGLLCRRLTEIMRLLSDSKDQFGEPPLLGMYWPAEEAAERSERTGTSSALLAGQDDAVIEMLTRTTNVDPNMANELLSLVSAR